MFKWIHFKRFGRTWKRSRDRFWSVWCFVQKMCCECSQFFCLYNPKIPIQVEDEFIYSHFFWFSVSWFLLFWWIWMNFFSLLYAWVFCANEVKGDLFVDLTQPAFKWVSSIFPPFFCVLFIGRLCEIEYAMLQNVKQRIC